MAEESAGNPSVEALWISMTGVGVVRTSSVKRKVLALDSLILEVLRMVFLGRMGKLIIELENDE